MDNRTPDFFRYLLPSAAAEPWGVAVTGGGRFQAIAGAEYPPVEHPSDHYFDWGKGRVLGAFQVVWIARGTGAFESRATGRLALSAGMGVLLFPGVWHRYRPRAETGWTEKWLELGGAAVERLLRAGVFSPRRAVIVPGRSLECEQAVDDIHKLISGAADGAEPEMAAKALLLLSRLAGAEGAAGADKPIDRAVAQAKRLMEEDAVDAPAMPELARRLGVGYSYFRREFRSRTGFSPQQYQLRLRMQRAQRLLGATEHSIKEIADRLKFSSPYHFSAAFKAHFGLSPRAWREQKQAGPDGANAGPLVT